MKSGHISFDTLSKFCDDAVISKQERDRIEHHLKGCQECGLELNRLKKMLNMVSYLNNLCMTPGCGFANDTIARIKKQRNIERKARFGLMPASIAAALTLIAIGSYFYINSPINVGTDVASNHDENIMSAAKFHGDDAINALNVLQNSSVRILMVTDNYIIGETNLSNYFRLKRELKSQINLLETAPVNANLIEVGTRNDPRMPHTEILSPSLYDQNSDVQIRVNIRR